MSFPHSRVVVAGIFLLANSGCDRAGQSGHSLPVLPEAPLTDEFAGKTVVDAGVAQGIVMARMANAPVTGESAPEAEFVGVESGSTVRLSEMLREKPAVLIFGSGSCSALNVADYQIERLAKRYAEFANFFFVYLREAHPAGGFNPYLTGSSSEENLPEIEDADSLEARRATAAAFAERVGFSFTVLSDTMDDAAAVRWSGWPLRIFVIDQSGGVLYAGDQGPWHFKPVDSYEHEPPPPGLDAKFRKRNFDRISLGEFLEGRFGSGK